MDQGEQRDGLVARISAAGRALGCLAIAVLVALIAVALGVFDILF